MGYISNQIKSGIGSQLKQLNTNDISKRANAALSNLGMPVDEINKHIKFDGATLNQITDKSNLKVPDGLSLDANMKNYIPKPVTDLFGNLRLPSEIGGVAVPQLPDLSSVTSQVESMLGSIGLDGLFSESMGIRDISSILKDPNMTQLYATVNVPTPTVEMPAADEAFKDIDLTGLNGDIDMLSGKIPGVGSLTDLL